jgi:hypothetical protein
MVHAWTAGTALGVMALPVVAAALAQAPALPASRGALLYDTHCIACHNSQMHWRDRRLVTDWDSLTAQVRHWQEIGRLGWSESDVVEVARHLNETIYRLPQASRRLTLRGGPAAR